ncbi:hypothetical protein BLNAU_18257 [Blattamonas nauphoetae]|uniref:Right handed beta helix domain-containing protein n=1 Tax=Blattamonas nauphoetae TaxID=2049346 RepID=A0ABQ9X4U1_9EUKA|nr:hypothetical protein BLNAU_18257 [Blattamonas nauphoetae]
MILETTLHLTGTPNTMLIPLSASDQSPLLTAQNSSLRIVSMTLSSSGRCLCLENSSATLFGTRLLIGSEASSIEASSSAVELISTTFVPSPNRLFPSIIKTVSTDCFVGLHNLEIQNGIVGGDEPLLASKETSTVLSSNNKILNMTHTSHSHLHTITEISRKTSLISTQLECVDDPFYGSIVAHINTGGEFFFSNSSFKSIVRTAVSDITCPEGGCTTSLGNFTTSSLTISSCNFTGCQGTDFGGSFFYNFTTGSFTCQDSNFTNCVSRRHGGGFELQYHTQSTITRNRFTNCRAAECGGGMVANTGFTSMTISNCSFFKCHGTSGSGLHRNDAGPSTTISGLIFDDCKSLCGLNFDQIGRCGAFFLQLSQITQLSGCSVKNAQLGLDGAAITCKPTATSTLSAYDFLIEGSIPQRPDGMEEERYNARLADIRVELTAATIVPPAFAVTPHGLFIGTTIQTTGRTSSITVAFTPNLDSSQSPPFTTAEASFDTRVYSPLFSVPASTKVIWECVEAVSFFQPSSILAEVNGSFEMRSIDLSPGMSGLQYEPWTNLDNDLVKRVQRHCTKSISSKYNKSGQAETVQ